MHNVGKLCCAVIIICWPQHSRLDLKGGCMTVRGAVRCCVVGMLSALERLDYAGCYCNNEDSV